MSSLEFYLANIQGKGSGWNLQDEVSVASSHVHRQGAVIFDVGANIGEWSAHMLGALGFNKCQLFQFEPSQRCQSILRALNLPHTTLIGAAVGDKAGTATLYSPGEEASGITSLYPRREPYFQQLNKFTEETVDVVTIDEIVSKYEIDTVDFMKLDVEGHELAVLRGARETLKSKRIKALAFEFGSGNINSRTYFRDFWDCLSFYGYTIKRICPGGLLLPVEEYSEDLEFFRGVSNYLAVLE